MLNIHTTGLLRLVVCSALVLVSLLGIYQPIVHASGGLPSRSARISNPTANAISTYRIAFNITQTATALGSIEMEFCANDPLPNTSCVVPFGLDLAGATLTQSGNTGFSISGTSTANRILLTRFPSLPLGGPSVYEFANVINPSNAGSYYIRLQTFSNNTGTGANVEDGGLVFSITSGVSVTSTVPPYLRFCTSVTITGFDCSTATNFLIDMGEFSSNSTAVSSSEMVVATNAGLGYSITMLGTTFTSGNNIIPASETPVSSQTGSSQFGVNLRSNTNPSIGSDPAGPGIGTINGSYNAPNQFAFKTGDIIVSSSGSTDNRKYTMSYMTNVSAGQPSGIYATTLSFICLANF